MLDWRILVHEIAGFSEYILAVIELFHGNLPFFWRCEFDEHHAVEVIGTLFFNFSNPCFHLQYPTAAPILVSAAGRVEGCKVDWSSIWMGFGMGNIACATHKTNLYQHPVHVNKKKALDSRIVTQENPWQNTTYLDGIDNQVSQRRSTMNVQGLEKQ